MRQGVFSLVIPLLHKDGKAKRRTGRMVTEPYRVPPDSELELTVVMQYQNQPLKFVHAPRFPKKKTYSWWCILGDTEVDELVAIKKVISRVVRSWWRV